MGVKLPAQPSDTSGAAPAAATGAALERRARQEVAEPPRVFFFYDLVQLCGGDKNGKMHQSKVKKKMKPRCG